MQLRKFHIEKDEKAHFTMMKAKSPDLLQNVSLLNSSRATCSRPSSKALVKIMLSPFIITSFLVLNKNIKLVKAGRICLLYTTIAKSLKIWHMAHKLFGL